ncbi:autotransporter domain-containing protein [Marilutibacter aestuarii]|uniref:S8 family serine peptidase n=1 Tax=Marilutibacter aestuarii TaxID=1706195 RepID=A0A508AME8_9GAMM|nr:autotransporter serine protease [Lysobacter aestuarii]TQD51106.1 S8 family serine peptidase [Lysobacter aestuarii]
MKQYSRDFASTGRGQVRSVLSSAIVVALLLGSAGNALAQDAADYQEEGRVGDADSWHSDEFKADWGLAAIGADHAYARGLTGRGIRLGVFDSGADQRHGDFAGKDHRSIRMADPDCTTEAVLAGPDACFSSDGDRAQIEVLLYTEADRELVDLLIQFGWLVPDANEILEGLAGVSYNTHGTHVAGTMLANRNGSGTHGVAFGSDLTTARLFGNSYQDVTSLLSDIFGIDFGGTRLGIGPGGDAVNAMYEQMAAQGVRAINHSWGLATEPTTVEDMDALYGSEGAAEYLSTYTNASLRDGMLQVWAAGNGSGDIAGLYASLPRWVPEAEKYWLSVVNINQGGGIDGSSSICGQTMDWCVAAPGTDITSTVIGGDVEIELMHDADGNVIGFQPNAENPQFGYGDLTGTSMATPHVTGALALLMERFPYLDNPQVRDVLLTTATDLGAKGIDEIYGWGLIDLKKAIDGPGMLRVDTRVEMNVFAGGQKVWDGPAWDDWRNDISGPGRLTKSGIGWLRLSGDNSFAGLSVEEGVLELDGDNALAGAAEVNGGFFVLNGTLRDTDLTVNDGLASIQGTVSGGLTTVGVDGRLHGTGVLGDTRVAGTIAPGNSVGTLRVDGDYTQLAGSVFEVEFEAPGAVDLIDVSGSADLQGGTVKLLRGADAYLLGRQYNILSASGGVTGAFDGLDASAISPFLSFSFSYLDDRVALDVLRGQLLADAAGTRNQRAVGAAVDGLAFDQALAQRLTQLFPAQAMDALDQLSGELHASARSVMAEGQRQLRDSALARAAAGQGGFAHQDEAGSSAWVQASRDGGTLEGDGNAARVEYSGNTTLVGYDYRFDNGLRLGVMGGTGRSDLNARDRASKGDLTGYRVGLYAGKAWGGLGVRGGVTHDSSEVDVRRNIAFPGLIDATWAEYDATSTQAFIEAGYRFGRGAWEIEPYLQYAHVTVDTDGFEEAGGITALHGDAADGDVNLATAGLRFNANLKAAHQAESWLSLRGGIGYRDASGDLQPTTRVAWDSGDAFVVAGAPLAEDATVAELGLAARLGENSLLEFGYSGQFGDAADAHGLNARYSLQF